MKVTIYSKPGCPQCNATRRALENRGIEYIEHDIVSDPWARIDALQTGFRSAPIVVAGDRSWAGYRPDLIAEI